MMGISDYQSLRVGLVTAAVVLTVATVWANRTSYEEFLGIDSQLSSHTPTCASDEYSEAWIRTNVTQARSGDVVRVEWAIPNCASTDDWIGVYSPDTADMVEFLDYHNITTTEASQNRGSFIIRMFNYRSDFGVRYYVKLGNGTELEVTRSAPVHFDIEEPTLTKLSLTGVPGEVRLMWVSGSQSPPIVEWGDFGQIFTHKKKGTSSTYSASDICAWPANISSPVWHRDPGLIHDVILDGLTSGTKYAYRYGASHSWRTGTFVAPKSIAISTETKLLVYADQGVNAYLDKGHTSDPAPPRCDLALDKDGGAEWCGGWASQGAEFQMAGVLRDPFVADGTADAALVFGDLSYDVGHQYVWEQWGTLVEPMASKIPMLIGVGNHEYCYRCYESYLGRSDGDTKCTASDLAKDPSKYPREQTNYCINRAAHMGGDGFGACGLLVARGFHMPYEKSHGNGVFWYSVDVGNMHIVMISTEHNLGSGSTQGAWLDNDLSSVNRSKTPWVIVAGHRPTWSIDFLMDDTDTGYSNGTRVGRILQRTLEPVLIKYEVNVVLQGHIHWYERTCAMAHGKCVRNHKAPVYVTVGTGGCSIDTYKGEVPEFIVTPPISAYGHARISATESMLHFEFVLTENGTVADEFTIDRS